ncbi:SHUGOSHIN 1 [Lotus japonicus]|uniref:SHUGOSHIN 1 n=1 Tax=Lotus japonicus TaxID=34305 RepID=UPI002582D7B2|nr:SHUGOSHIN 1 [Lotus japonicus]
MRFGKPFGATIINLQDPIFEFPSLQTHSDRDDEMDGGAGIFLDSDTARVGAVGVAGQKAKRGKMVKGDSVSVGTAQKKKLADITNRDQQQRPITQQANQQAATIAAPGITSDQLLNENAMLMKVLANRNAVIESCKAELQKSQTNYLRLRKENSELALTNTHIMAELNSSKQRLRELQHELGMKNGMLRAMKLELTAKEHTEKSNREIEANEVKASHSKELDQTLQEDAREKTKRKRVSRSQSSAPAVIKQVKSIEKVENKRYSLRRQSAGLQAEKSQPTEDSEVAQVKYDVAHLQENLENENGPTSSEVHEEAKEDAESSGPANTEQVHAKKNIENKRQSLRRQSSMFKPENLEPTEDFFEVDDAKFPVLCATDMSEQSHPTTSSVTSGQENNTCVYDPREIRRSSVGRPSRRSAVKVVSYKEIPVNVKMRRPN